MVSRIVAAVIGCGRMGAFTSDSVRRFAPPFWFPLSHVEAIKSHPRLDLRALADLDATMLERAAAAHNVAAVYTDSSELLDAVRPRLVGIATRTTGRAGLISQAVASGTRALHIEKPLCNSVRELATLHAILDRADIFVTYGAIRRFLSVYRQARDLADSGIYGALREIRVNLGAAPLFWTHPHSIDLILFAAGGRHVSGVQAHFADVVYAASRTDIESDPRIVAATIYFDGGVAGHITQALGADFVLSCADAEITVRADGNAIDIYAARNGEAYPTLAPLDGTAAQFGAGGTLAPVSQLVACLDGSTAAIDDNSIVKGDILKGQQIAFAMLQSHLEGSRIVNPEAIDGSIFIHARTGGRPA